MAEQSGGLARFANFIRQRFAGEARASQTPGSGMPVEAGGQQQAGQSALPEVDLNSPILRDAGGGFENGGDPDAYAARQDFRPGVNQ